MGSGEGSSLAGKRVVITRAVEQSSELVQLLRQCGATVIALPLISFAEPEDFFLLDAALLEWKSFDWVLFTSANAVRAVKSRGDSLSQNLSRTAKALRIAVVGPATKAAAEAAGFSVDYLAKTHLGTALAEELGERLRGKRVFLPRSDRANPDLPEALAHHGALVTEVTAYRTVPPEVTDREKLMQVANGEADAVIFFSPTAVQNFVELAGCERTRELRNKVAFVAVGPVTVQALRRSGIDSVVIAADTTAVHVVSALENYFAGASQGSAPRVNRT